VTHLAARQRFESENDCNSGHLKTLGAMPEAACRAFERIRTRLGFPAKTLVFVEGQRPTGVFIVRTGRVKLSVTSREGRTLVLRIAEEGEVLGLQANFLSARHFVTAETMTPTTVDFAVWPDFHAFMKAHSEALLALIHASLRECVDAYALAQRIGLPVNERLGYLLLGAALRGNPAHDTGSIQLRLTHEEIAQLIGTSRETVTRLLSDFKKRGLLEWNGCTLKILKPTELESICKLETAGMGYV